MNRITLYAQLLGVLVFCIAASAIADPAQGQVKRVLKGVSGDEPGTLKGYVKWGDIVLKARAISPDGPRALRESLAPSTPTPIQLKVQIDWGTEFSRPSIESMNRVLRGDRRTRAAELQIGTRKATFQKALITEIGFPALDGASKEPAYMTVKMSGEAQPAAPAEEAVRLSRTAKSPTEGTASTEKKWLPSNFRVRIDGLDCRNVTKVSPLLMRASKNPGSNRVWGDPHILEITLPESEFRAANLAKWEGPDFDASKNEIRPRTGQIVLWVREGSPLIAASFRMFQIRRVRSASGKVTFEAVVDRFELSRS